MKRKKKTDRKTLTERTTIRVRFSEVDSMGIVWHGNYMRYFEDGREAFGKCYDIGYMDVFKNKLVSPLVKMNFNFRKPLRYGDEAIVETTYIDTETAVIQFEYTIYNAATNDIVTYGESTQAFVNTDGELMLTFPEFYIQWKKKWGILA